MSVTSFDPDEGRKTFPENPWTHHCDVKDVDYTHVKSGSLNCEQCGATWRLNPEKGWIRTPDPGRTYTRRKP